MQPLLPCNKPRHDSPNSCCFFPFQGTLDLLLITEDGWERAHVALKWMYEQLRTPGSLFYISHSPPHDRVAMLTSVYWHDAQVREPVAQVLAMSRMHKPQSIAAYWGVSSCQTQTGICAECPSYFSSQGHGLQAGDCKLGLQPDCCLCCLGTCSSR